jgi:hypothetical protein
MQLNIAKEQTALERLSVGELRERYAEVFGESTRANNRVWLIRRILWRMQALAEGDLSERARQRAAELANDADLRVIAPKEQFAVPMACRRTETTALAQRGDDRLPPPGSVIVREYKGESLRIKVLADGFEYEGEVYKTLSSLAKAITGTHTNGFLFFKLGEHGGKQ